MRTLTGVRDAAVRFTVVGIGQVTHTTDQLLTYEPPAVTEPETTIFLVGSKPKRTEPFVGIISTMVRAGERLAVGNDDGSI